MRDAYTGVPELVVGAWRGYRIWRISGDRLTAWWYREYTWLPGVSEATCSATRWAPFKGCRSRHPDLPAPQRDCRCGLYALHQPWEFVGDPPSRVFGAADLSEVAVGVVAGWGRAFRGERGWRAQFAKPMALYRAPQVCEQDEQVERIARRYGCEVVDRPEDLLAVAGQRA
jgi:hypothetical protein